MDFDWIRSLRTPSSERYLLRMKGSDFAALDIHYRVNATVDATLIVFENSGVTESQIPAILSRIDEAILPDVSVGERSLTFNVVIGRVLGAFTPHPPSEG